MNEVADPSRGMGWRCFVFGTCGLFYGLVLQVQ